LFNGFVRFADKKNSEACETPRDSRRTVSTPENVERARQAILKSTSRSALRRVTELYERKRWALEDVKTVIREKIEEIGLMLVNRVDANFRERLQTCIRENGRHLSDIVLSFISKKVYSRAEPFISSCIYIHIKPKRFKV